MLASSQLGAEGIEPGAPVLAELVEPAIHFLQWVGIDGIQSPGPFGAYGSKAGLPQDTQMLRYRRLANPEFCGDNLNDRTGRMFSRSQKLQDPTPYRITEDV
jgi:hypothetical protein